MSRLACALGASNTRHATTASYRLTLAVTVSGEKATFSFKA